MTITQEQFDSLLSWLDADRELAGRKYETIRSGLIRIFVSRGLNDAEDLADETINRVMLRLPSIRKNYKGEPACYFYGVARNIIRECRKRKEFAAGIVDVRIDPQADASEEHDILGHCLNCLSVSKRNLILDYYLYEGHSKIENRRRIARQLKLTLGAVRNRAFQIRLHLENCMRRCALKEESLVGDRSKAA
jgi:RNA polymerase sigma factor (sigma-70 family)